MTNSTGLFSDFSIKDYQTFIGAVVGFTGITATLLWNSWQTRRAARKTISDSKNSLLSAFYGELSTNQDIVARNIATIRGDSLPRGSDDVLGLRRAYLRYSFLEKFPQEVYSKNVDKIGSLGALHSLWIVNAYSELIQLPSFFAVLQKRLKRSGDLSIDEVNEYARVLEEILRVINTAIERIKDDDGFIKTNRRRQRNSVSKFIYGVRSRYSLPR
jgi:hypothetical protein